jgi:hypothetical protein
MSIRKWLSYVAIVFSVAGCSADIDDYQSTQPQFNLFGYFTGESHAWGMVQDYTDLQTRRFSVKLIGEQTDPNTLVLREWFDYDDGEKSERVWTIKRTSDGTYTGEADDIIGVASGREQGNAFNWRYDFKLKLDDSDVVVHFDDWLFRQDSTHLFNITKIKKFGLEVGRVTLFFEKTTAEQ